MNTLAKLDQLNLEPTTKTEVAALIQPLVEQVERDAKLIQAKDIKIGALTYELAYYKRIRFSRKNESLAPLQRDVFEETWNTDMSAIEPIIGHLKNDGLLGRNYLKGELCDALHAILCGAGHNIRLILRRLRIFWPHVWQSLSRLWGAFSSEPLLSFA